MMSVFVCEDIFKNRKSKVYKIFCTLPMAVARSPLPVLLYVMYFRFCWWYRVFILWIAIAACCYGSSVTAVISAVTLSFRHLGIRTTRHMTLSTKPEVQNVSQRRHGKTKPRPQWTCIKFCEVRPYGIRVMLADRQTKKQTNRLQTYLSQYFAPLTETK